MLSAAIVAGGCAGPGAQPAEGPTTGAQGAFPRTVTHVMGDTEILAEPTRIVTLAQTFLDAALVLELEVVAFTEYRGGGGAGSPYLAEPVARLAPDARLVGRPGRTTSGCSPRPPEGRNSPIAGSPSTSSGPRRSGTPFGPRRERTRPSR